MTIFTPYLLKAAILSSLFMSSVAPHAAGDTPLRIMPLGDSLTEGAITHDGVLYNVGGYRKLVADDISSKLDFTFVGTKRDRAGVPRYMYHEGHGGWALLDFIGERRTMMGYPQGDDPAVVTYVRRDQPDIILLEVGTNDNTCGQDEFVRRYTKLLTQIYSVTPDVKIVWAMTTPKLSDKSGAMLRDSHAAVPIVIKAFPSKTIVVVDPSAGFDATTMTIDGVHPNETGNPLLAKAMEKGLQQLTNY